jgi:hypothetical protein
MLRQGFFGVEEASTCISIRCRSDQDTLSGARHLSKFASGDLLWLSTGI